MKRGWIRAFLLSMLCAAVLDGCASASRDAAFRSRQVELFRARQGASVICDSSVDCDRAWARTRSFIKTHSASRIIRADDTVIETGDPHSFGFVYLAATKSPTDDGHTLIQLRAMCRGMYDSDGNAALMYSTCAKSIVEVEGEFRAWMGAAR
ncbi:hypothetical protein VSR68_10730 [Paraburkholderia phymatum]|uniref:hypothetical protein n=1 Tax=Paraburkholderia phymatum TaxID=148447 RepID=UPI00316E19F7